FTISGMMAPASVPQEMMTASFHQSVVSPARLGTSAQERRNVMAMETSEVSHTSEVSGASKLNFFASPYFPLAQRPFSQYETALVTIMPMRMTKIHTRS